MAWNIDTTHSSISFTVRHMVFSKVRGSFQNWSAELQLDGDDLTAAKVRVHIDPASINTGVEQRDNHLRSPDFFDAQKFPEAIFQSRKISQKGDAFEVDGELTLRGVTKGVTLSGEVLGRGKDPWGNARIGLAATTKIDRREFGLTWNQALEAGGVLVGENVELEIAIEAVEKREELQKVG